MTTRNHQESNIQNLLIEAESHAERGEWANALACYEQALRSDPQDETARAGCSAMIEKLKCATKIQEQLANGRQLRAKQQLNDARQLLSDALALGIAQSVFSSHAEVSTECDLVQDALNWRATLDKTMAAAQRLVNDGSPAQAIAMQHNVLRDLVANGQDEMATAARVELTTILARADIDVLVTEMQRVFALQDYARACEMARLLHERHHDHTEIKRLAVNFCRRWDVLREQLERTQARLHPGKLDDGMALLDEMRTIMPENPQWRALWLRIYGERGMKLVLNARTTLVRQDFSAVAEAAEGADAALQAVINVFPGHTLSEHLQRELGAWRRCAQCARQAQDAETAMQWDTALALLGEVHRHVLELTPFFAGHDASVQYADVLSMLTRLELNIRAKQAQLNEARKALGDGEVALIAKNLDLAGDCFRHGLDALGELPDADLRAALAMRQREAAELRRLVQEMLVQAQTASEQQIDLLQQVHDLWPTAPGMPILLGDKLLAEAERALAADQLERAAEFARSVLGLTLLPDDFVRHAEVLLQQVDCSGQVQAAIQTVMQHHATASLRDALPAVEEYRALVKLLTEADLQAQRSCAGKASAVASALAVVQPLLQALEQALPLLDKAKVAEAQGEWPAAADYLTTAVALMGENCPASLRLDTDRVVTIAAAIQEQIDLILACLAKVQTTYRSGVNGRLIDIDWNALFGELAVCRPAIERVKQIADPAPPAIVSLDAQYRDLEERARLLHEVYEAERSGQDEALRRLNAASERFAGDIVMTSAFSQMRQAQSKYIENRAHELLVTAHDLAMRGEWQEAHETLGPANAIYFDPAVLERERQQIELQRQVWGEIASLQLDTTQPSAPTSKFQAYDEAVVLASHANSGLDEAIRTALTHMRSIFVALRNPVTFGEQHALLLRQAQDACDQMLRSGVVQPLRSRFFALVKRWYDLNLREVRLGFVASADALGNYVDAYAVAREQLRDAPDDAEIGSLVIALRARMLDQVQSRVNQLLLRTESSAAAGDFDQPAANFAAIDELIAALRQRFPEVDDTSLLQQQLQNVAATTAQIAILKQRADRLYTLIAQIETMYINGNLDDAERAIAEADLIDPERSTRFLWEQLDRLRALLRRRREENLVARIDGLLTSIRRRLDTDESITLAQMKSEVLAPLEAHYARTMGLNRDAYSDRQREFERLLAETIARLRDLQEVELAWQTAQALTDEKQWEDALAALERGLQLARGRQRTVMQHELERLSPLVEQQRQRKQAIEAGNQSLSQRHFGEAAAAFAVALQFDASDAEIRARLEAAHAGDLLERARAQMSINLTEAEHLLHDAIRVASHAAPAQELRREAQTTLAEVGRRLKLAERIVQLIQKARNALAVDHLDEANESVDAILVIEPTYLPAQELKQKIAAAMRAQMLLQRAREFYVRNNYREAMVLAQQSMELHLLAATQELIVQIETEQEAGEALSRAESLAQEDRFAEARRELQGARDLNPTHPRLLSVQRAIEDLEEQFIVSVRRPIDEAYRRRNYREAMRAIEAARKTTDLPELSMELQQRQHTLLTEWVHKIATDFRDSVQGDEGEMADKVLDSTLQQTEDVLSAAAGATDATRQKLQEMLDELEIRLGLLRLEKGRRLLTMLDLTDVDLHRCERIAQETLVSAEKLSDFHLRWKALDFLQAVDDRRLTAVRSDRNGRLQAVHIMVAQAVARDDLDVAHKRISEILDIPGYEGDEEAINLRAQIAQEIARFGVTSERLETARRSLRNGNYRGAYTALQSLETPSRLLHTELAQVTNLATALIAAEEQENENPEVALGIYEQAAADAYELAPSLSIAIARCRTVLFEQFERETNDSLYLPVPDIDAASQRLHQLRQPGWVKNASQAEQLAQLEILAARKASLANAIQLLGQNTDASDAVVLLERAQHLAADTWDVIDAGWLAIAKAFVALDASQFDEAEHLAEMAPLPLQQTELFQMFTQKLAQARQGSLETATATAPHGVNSDLDRILATVAEALGLLDLTAAEDAMVAAREYRARDARIRDTEQQIESCRQLVPVIEQAMLRGWDALHRHELDAARTAFIRAVETARFFPESQVWVDYVTALLGGLAEVTGEHYAVAVDLLLQAETVMRHAAALPSSPLWGKRLAQERVRATYYAMRVRQRAEQMLAERRQGDIAKQQNNFEQALMHLSRLRTLRNEFPSFVRSDFEPEPDFSAVSI